MKHWLQRSASLGAGLLLTLCLAAIAVPAQMKHPTRTNDAARHSKAAAKVFNEIMRVPEKAIPRDLLDKADAIAVFPGVVKAAFIFGGRGGQGVISRRTSHGWSAPAFFNLGGGSFGPQIGAQKTDYVLLIMNDDGLKGLLEDKFEFGGEASLAAGPVGRTLSASTNATLDAAILSYSRTKGAFIGASLKGAVISPDNDLNNAFYGMTARELLSERGMTMRETPTAVSVFPQTLTRYSRRENNHVSFNPAGATFINFDSAQEQTYQRAYRLSDSQVEEIIHRLESDAKTFRQSLDNALDAGRLDGTKREDEVNARIKDFEEATKRLHDHFDGHRSVAGDVQNVLDRATRIDEYMHRRSLDELAQKDWTAVKGDLDQLASAYTVTWKWQLSFLPFESQPTPSRINDRQVGQFLSRTDRDADSFRRSLNHALDRSRLDGSAREDNVNQFVKEFREATKQLRDRFDGRTSVAADVESVLARAGRINNFMASHLLDRAAQRDWARVRSDLEQLAQAYSVRWNWTDRTL